MSLQQIINMSNSIKIDRRKVIGIQMTRSQLIRIGETPTYNPWRMTVSVPNMSFANARTIIETLDNMDRGTSEVIKLGSIDCMKFMYRYLGDLNPGQFTQITVQQFIGNQMTINVDEVVDQYSNPVDSNTYLFRKGDLFSVYGHPYPFTCVADVKRGPAPTVTFTTHRPRVINPEINISNLTLNSGPNAEFRMLVTKMPTYTLTPGAYKKINGVVINHAILSFDSEFELTEQILL